MKQRDVLQKTTTEIAAIANNNPSPHELLPAVMRFLGEVATMPVFVLGKRVDETGFSPLVVKEADSADAENAKCYINVFCTEDEAWLYCKSREAGEIEKGCFPWTASAQVVETTMQKVGALVQKEQAGGLEIKIAFTNENGHRLVLEIPTILNDVRAMLGL